MHPNKHIREALKYAEEQGWRFIKSRGHAVVGTATVIVKNRFGQRHEAQRITRRTFATKSILAQEQ
jgi:hypothetical protein